MTTPEELGLTDPNEFGFAFHFADSSGWTEVVEFLAGVDPDEYEGFVTHPHAKVTVHLPDGWCAVSEDAFARWVGLWVLEVVSAVDDAAMTRGSSGVTINLDDINDWAREELARWIYERAVISRQQVEVELQDTLLWEEDR